MTSESQTIIGEKIFPVVSIILPVHPQYPDIKNDTEHLHAIFNDVKNQLQSLYGYEKSKMMFQKTEHAIRNIPVHHLSKSLIIYVTPETEKIISLPFHVSEKVIVDDSFEVRDLIYAAKRNRNYLTLMISQNKVTTLLCNNTKMFSAKYAGMPDNVKDVMNEHSYPGRDYLDIQQFDEKNIHNYLRFIDEVVEKELRNNELPVVVTGDVKLLGYFKKNTRNAGRIIGYVDGNYDHANATEIRSRTENLIEEQIRNEENHALSLLADAISKNNYAAGITEVWRAVAEGRGKLLLVEKDYRIQARHGNDEYSIVIDNSELNPHNIIRDAVDDVIETVLKNNGDVIFIENKMQPEYQHIALITRY